MKKNELHSRGVREPVFAGKFYPASEKRLIKQLNKLFAHAKEPAGNVLPRAILAPHAGYDFSGRVAASAFNQLIHNSSYKRVFILAASHQYAFSGASLSDAAFYKTPLGLIKIDEDVSDSLAETSTLFRKHNETHQYEHSLEVLLPFLQHKLDNSFLMVPMVLGTHDIRECEQLARQLEPWFTPENLFVVSTDFSHYPAYHDAVENDFNTAHAICSNNPHTLIRLLEQNRNIDNLATSLCGWTAVATLLFLTQNKNMEYALVHYQNSGDAEKYGDKEKVVGYWAMAVYEKQEPMLVSREMQNSLLRKARQAVTRFVESGESEHESSAPGLEDVPAGMFLSIYIKNELRGCMGNFDNNLSLNDEVEHLAVSAACDCRFDNISKEELEDMELEISVLTPLQRIHSIEEFEPGRHGIYIRKGSSSGTYLPKVAGMAGWSAGELLGHCARDKANIGWDGWKDAELYVYEAFVFKG